MSVFCFLIVVILLFQNAPFSSNFNSPGQIFHIKTLFILFIIFAVSVFTSVLLKNILLSAWFVASWWRQRSKADDFFAASGTPGLNFKVYILSTLLLATADYLSNFDVVLGVLDALYDSFLFESSSIHRSLFSQVVYLFTPGRFIHLDLLLLRLFWKIFVRKQTSHVQDLYSVLFSVIFIVLYLCNFVQLWMNQITEEKCNLATKVLIWADLGIWAVEKMN